MKNVCTYLLIKSSVLSVTSMVKPEEPSHRFFDSFIKVDNPNVALTQLYSIEYHGGKTLDHITEWKPKDGLYPAPDGIEFEVSTISLSGNGWSAEERVAVVSLIGDKEEKKLPTLHEHNEKKRELYDKPVDNNAGVACEKCGKEMQYKDQNLVTLSNPPMTQVICECGNSGYKVI